MTTGGWPACARVEGSIQITQEDKILKTTTARSPIQAVWLLLGVFVGEVFDRVYQHAALTAPPLTDMQTTRVPAGGAAVVEFTLQVPGRYLLVDHVLARVERGLVGVLLVQGSENVEVFRSGSAP
jgi:hypothetical protein